jgi:hypothetical protein
MAEVFREEFTDTNGTALEDHDAGWDHISGAPDIEIQSNKGEATSNSAISYYRYTTDQPSDADATMKADIYGTSGKTTPGIGVRVASNGYGVYGYFVTDTWYLFHNDAGGPSVDGTYAGDTPSGEPTVQIIPNGNDFALEIGGVERISETITGYAAAESGGLLLAYTDASGTTIDNAIMEEDGGGGSAVPIIMQMMHRVRHAWKKRPSGIFVPDVDHILSPARVVV